MAFIVSFPWVSFTFSNTSGVMQCLSFGLLSMYKGTILDDQAIQVLNLAEEIEDISMSFIVKLDGLAAPGRRYQPA